MFNSILILMSRNFSPLVYDYAVLNVLNPNCNCKIVIIFFYLYLPYHLTSYFLVILTSSWIIMKFSSYYFLFVKSFSRWGTFGSSCQVFHVYGVNQEGFRECLFEVDECSWNFSFSVSCGTGGGTCLFTSPNYWTQNPQQIPWFCSQVMFEIRKQYGYSWKFEIAGLIWWKGPWCLQI